MHGDYRGCDEDKQTNVTGKYMEAVAVSKTPTHVG